MSDMKTFAGGVTFLPWTCEHCGQPVPGGLVHNCPKTPPSHWTARASPSPVFSDAERDALAAQVATLREELEKMPALVWEMLKLREDATVANQGREIAADVVGRALSSTAQAAREHDARVRDAAQQDARKFIATLNEKLDETHTHRCFNCERTVTGETVSRQAEIRDAALEEAAALLDKTRAAWARERQEPERTTCAVMADEVRALKSRP